MYESQCIAVTDSNQPRPRGQVEKGGDRPVYSVYPISRIYFLIGESGLFDGAIERCDL